MAEVEDECAICEDEEDDHQGIDLDSEEDEDDWDMMDDDEDGNETLYDSPLDEVDEILYLGAHL